MDRMTNMGFTLQIRMYLLGICTLVTYLHGISDDPPEIGLVLACYERPQYLKRTLNSLSSCDLQDTILYIIDDHSKNREVKTLIEQFVESQPHLNIITLRHKKNLGIRKTLLEGWDYLRSLGCKYLCNLDSDTIHKPHWLQELRHVYSLVPNYLKASHYILSGFNCTSGSHKVTKQYPHFYKKASLGGMNFFFDLKTYKKVVRPSIAVGNKNRGWDWAVVRKAQNTGCALLATRPSVVQHIGFVGLNSCHRCHDYAHDF